MSNKKNWSQEKKARMAFRKANRDKVKKIVDDYIKRHEIKAEVGKIEPNPVLVVSPENMDKFYVSGVFAGLTREEKHLAKQYFKSKLPFAEYYKSRGKDPEKKIADIIHFHELQDEGGI